MPNPESPENGTSFSYLALLQPHLDVIQVFLRNQGHAADTTLHSRRLELKCDHVKNDRLAVSVMVKDEAFRGPDKGDRILADIVLPSSVEFDSHAVTASFSDGILDFKVPARRFRAPAVPEDPRLSAKELQDYGPNAIRCRFCSVPLVTLGDGALACPAFRPLPSPHYQELIEAYLCHPSGEFAKKMDSVGEKGFWPENTIVDGQVKPVILVGETELRVDAQHVEECLRFSDNDLSVDPLLASRWDDVRCRCGAIVGERNAHRLLTSESKGVADIRQTFKLWKHSISLTTNSKPTLSYPLEVFVMTEILSLAQAHSTRRFRLYDTEDEMQDSPRILLWLFQPDMVVSYGSSTEPATISQVAKILYTFPDPPSSESFVQRDNLQVEAIVCPKAIIDAVIASLKATTELLPERHRAMGSHMVGFLARR